MAIDSSGDSNEESPPADEEITAIPEAPATAHSEGPSDIDPTPALPTMGDNDGDSENDPDYEVVPQVDFFTSKSPRSNRHKWLVEFYEYLNLPAAGRKKTGTDFSMPVI